MAKLVTLYKGEGGKFEEKYLVATDWSLINDKPTNFVPTAHTHDERYYTETEVNNKDYLRSNIDNRNIDTIPDDYNSKFQIKGLKSNGVIGLNWSSEGDYSGVLGVRCWSGSSGGNAHEFALTGKGNIYHRHGATDTWNAWSKLAMVSDIPTTYDWAKVNNRPTTLSGYGITNAYTVSQVNTNFATKADLAGKLGTEGTAYDSARLNGKLASQYILASDLSIDYATKNYVTNSFTPISSYDKIVNGRTQVGNTKKVAGKEVKYFTQSAFASITPVTGVHYIVYEN